jgi:hypothetical protein
VDRQKCQAKVGNWQAGAISRDTMTKLFRRRLVLPEGRSREGEVTLIRREKSVASATPG